MHRTLRKNLSVETRARASPKLTDAPVLPITLTRLWVTPRLAGVTITSRFFGVHISTAVVYARLSLSWIPRAPSPVCFMCLHCSPALVTGHLQTFATTGWGLILGMSSPHGVHSMKEKGVEKLSCFLLFPSFKAAPLSCPLNILLYQSPLTGDGWCRALPRSAVPSARAHHRAPSQNDVG